MGWCMVFEFGGNICAVLHQWIPPSTFFKKKPEKKPYVRKFHRELMKGGDIRKDDKSIQYTFKGFLAGT